MYIRVPSLGIVYFICIEKRIQCITDSQRFPIITKDIKAIKLKRTRKRQCNRTPWPSLSHKTIQHLGRVELSKKMQCLYIQKAHATALFFTNQETVLKMYDGILVVKPTTFPWCLEEFNLICRMSLMHHPP